MDDNAGRLMCPDWDNQIVPQPADVWPVLRKIVPGRFHYFDGWEAAAWTRNNMYAAVIICVLYFVMCFGTKAVMRDRVPFSLKTPLALWNLSLSLFSLVGAAATMPQLLLGLYYQGAEFTICAGADAWYGCGTSGLFTALFIWSKVPELIDTVFIVLRKKKLMFLHWYHHISVLLFCWHSHGTMSAAGLWFVAMNYSVHGVMYMYYFLTAIGYRPPWAMFVTVIQISQMFVGIWVCVMTIWYKHHPGHACNVTHSNVWAGVVMYTSYMLLFVHFFVNRFCRGGSKKASAKATAAKKQE